MKTAIILLGGALLLMGCASGRSRATTVRAQPVASSTAPTPMATNYVSSSAMSTGYATAQPFAGGG